MHTSNVPKALKLAFSVAILATSLTLPTVAEQDSQAKTFNLRVLAYNVACGKWTTPEKFAEFLKPLNPDIVLLSEVPRLSRGKKGKDWSDRMADALGLGHVHVGSVSSANHKAPKLSLIHI